MLIKFITPVNYPLYMDFELINWIKDGKYRINTLELLASKPWLSSELADNLNINRASMSRILRGLKEKELVFPISGNSRTVTYTITKKGRELLKAVKGTKNE